MITGTEIKARVQADVGTSLSEVMDTAAFAIARINDAVEAIRTDFPACTIDDNGKLIPLVSIVATTGILSVFDSPRIRKALTHHVASAVYRTDAENQNHKNMSDWSMAAYYQAIGLNPMARRGR